MSLADAKRSTVGSKKAPGSATGSTGAPRELSRREREAIERERARQHFLKMKEKEDAARLAVIRKRREEEAALHAAELKGTSHWGWRSITNMAIFACTARARGSQGGGPLCTTIIIK